MGREIRLVPPNWQHPQYTTEDAPYSNRVGDYRPIYNRRFDEVFAKWLADFDRIRAGNLTDFERECYPNGLAEWLVDEGQPHDARYYLSYKKEDATWFQVYETVSEGTPVTPPFATKEEIVVYLVANGDFWDQQRGEGGWEREAAEQFVSREWSPSMMTVKTTQGTQVFMPRDGLPESKSKGQ